MKSTKTGPSLASPPSRRSTSRIYGPGEGVILIWVGLGGLQLRPYSLTYTLSLSPSSHSVPKSPKDRDSAADGGAAVGRDSPVRVSRSLAEPGPLLREVLDDDDDQVEVDAHEVADRQPSQPASALNLAGSSVPAGG